MIQQIIDGVIEALRVAFPEVTRVYTEEVKQGFKEPCFILRPLKPTCDQFLGNRYYRTNPLSVHYVPASRTDAKAECYDVNDRLFRALEYITVGDDLQRGTNMNGEYFDGTLAFFVSFNMFINVETNEEPNPMETFTIENNAN